MSQLYQKLWNPIHCRVQLQPIIVPLPKGYDQNACCAYHMYTPGHDTNNCRTLKHKLQDLINNSSCSPGCPKLRCQSPGFACSWTFNAFYHMVSVDDFVIDPLELIAPQGLVVCVRIARSDIPLMASVHYSLTIRIICGPSQ